MRRLTVLDILLLMLVLIVAASTLAPAVARMSRPYAETKCQANLHRWADAMALYCADNNGRFPTNRVLTASHALNPALPLSPPDPLPGQTEPPRFYYSVNWVEALYDYLQGAAAPTNLDWRSLRRCPNAGARFWPPINTQGYPFNCMTYVFNYNLVEYWRGLVRNPRKVMMLREFHAITIAVLRPMNVSTGQSNILPQYAFNNMDSTATAYENMNRDYWKRHGEGSYIVFTDGHVQYFSLDYYPAYYQMRTNTNWDAQTQQWWNYAPGSGMSAPYLKSIAITP